MMHYIMYWPGVSRMGAPEKGAGRSACWEERTWRLD